MASKNVLIPIDEAVSAIAEIIHSVAVAEADNVRIPAEKVKLLLWQELHASLFYGTWAPTSLAGRWWFAAGLRGR